MEAPFDWLMEILTYWNEKTNYENQVMADIHSKNNQDS